MAQPDVLGGPATGGAFVVFGFVAAETPSVPQLRAGLPSVIRLSPLGLGHAASYPRTTPASLRKTSPIRDTAQSKCRLIHSRERLNGRRALALHELDVRRSGGRVALPGFSMNGVSLALPLDL